MKIKGVEVGGMLRWRENDFSPITAIGSIGAQHASLENGAHAGEIASGERAMPPFSSVET